MVTLDRALIGSYRLSIVTMPLTEAVRPQFAMQACRGAIIPHLGEWWGVVRGPNWYHRVAVGQP